MKKVKYYIYALVVVLVFVLLRYVILTYSEPLYKVILKAITTSVTVLWVITESYNRWLWKNKYINRLNKIPNLEGLWKGEMNSLHPQAKNPILFEATILQPTYDDIIVKIRTNESESISKIAKIEIDERSLTTRLFYSYLNEPEISIRDRSQMHLGTTILTIDNNNHMHGSYWTDRKDGRGSIRFER